MTVVTIDAAFVMAKLNSLPPHSRLRSGYVDILREIRRQELLEEAEHNAFADEIERALEQSMAREMA